MFHLQEIATAHLFSALISLALGIIIVIMIIVIVVMIFELVVMVGTMTALEIVRDLPKQRVTDLRHLEAREQFILVRLLRGVMSALSIDIFHVELGDLISLNFI